MQIFHCSSALGSGRERHSRGVSVMLSWSGCLSSALSRSKAPWATISQHPNRSYGHLLLQDRIWQVCGTQSCSGVGQKVKQVMFWVQTIYCSLMRSALSKLLHILACRADGKQRGNLHSHLWFKASNVLRGRAVSFTTGAAFQYTALLPGSHRLADEV